jgi:hypothetical protein
MIAGQHNACPAYISEALFTAFHLGPRTRTHAVNFWILNFQGEQLGEDIGWRIDRRVITILR